MLFYERLILEEGTMEKLKFKQIMSLTLTLFAIFFGAGNMVFPPAMGQLAGENYWQALIGFILTDAGIALLGIIAVVLVGNEITDLGNLISKKFSIFLSIVVYLLIGPLFALPRTGSVSYELAAKPYVPSEYSWLVSLAVTAVFFAVTYFLSARPNKIVDIIGKYLTPILILSIVAIFFSCLFMDKSNHTIQYGATTASDAYSSGGAFFQGLVEGYNALDGPAGLVFAIIIINAVTGFGIKKRKNITKYTVICGIGAVIILSAIYFMLTYIGASTLTSFPNGGELLHAVTSDLLGTPGGIILGIAVLLACLTTSIGLTTSFSDYFHELIPSVSYQKIALIVCIFSFVISNVGLTQLVAVSLPVLMAVYPVLVVLIILSFFKRWIQHRRMIYVLSMAFAFCISFINGLDSANIPLGIVADWVGMLPLYDLNLGWMIPATIGAIIGILPFWPMNKKKTAIESSEG